MAKMSHRIRQTNNTLKMLGMAWMSALTTTYMGEGWSDFVSQNIANGIEKQNSIRFSFKKRSSISIITFGVFSCLLYFKGGNRTESKQRNRPCCYYIQNLALANSTVISDKVINIREKKKECNIFVGEKKWILSII